MAERQPKQAESWDPFQAMRDLLESGERRLNELLSERRSQADAGAIRARLSAASLGTQKRVWELWARYFEGINLPTRTDILRLGKRIAEVEEGVARIETRLRSMDRHLEALAQPESPPRAAPIPRKPAAPGGAQRPRRTRRPPGAEETG